MIKFTFENLIMNNQDSNSFNRVFRTLTLDHSESQTLEPEASQNIECSKIFKPFPYQEFQSQSLPIIDEEPERAHEERKYESGDEERKAPLLHEEAKVQEPRQEISF